MPEITSGYAERFFSAEMNFDFLRPQMKSAPSLRTLLVLGRVAQLPVVWSNCLAGWWLGGGGNFFKLPLLLAGASLLYLGGSFLNDLLDADFDRQRRPERPIPAGKISAQIVRSSGFLQLFLGIILLAFCGKSAAVAAIWLAFFILLYDFTHRFFTASPWLMGACRFWLFIASAATGMKGVNGFVIAGGFALTSYVAGVSYISRRERSRVPIPYWSLPLLLAPLVIAMLLNTGIYLRDALWISLVLSLWLARCVRGIFFAGGSNAGWMAANLIAGIPVVDWLAVAPIVPPSIAAPIFLTLLAATKGFQKIAPTS